MKLLSVVAVIALLVGPVYAQNAVPKYGETDKEKTSQQKADDREAERAYNKSLQNIPDQKSTDSWGSVRSDNAPKAAACGRACAVLDGGCRTAQRAAARPHPAKAPLAEARTRASALHAEVSTGSTGGGPAGAFPPVASSVRP